jgi:putative transposase
VRELAARTELPQERIVGWLGIGRAKFFDWKKRYGKVNEHNGWIPRDHWIEEHERQAILDFHEHNPLEGYRRLAFMMIDRDIVYVSPASVYRVLAHAGRLDRWNRKPSKKGTGFVQPLAPHEHWHVDISYLNLMGTFFYLCAVLDGASRAIVHWEIRESMTEAEVELVIQRAREKAPQGVRPRIISDNGPQFIARDFKEFIRITGLSHVRTAPFYPQSNGKIERFHKTLKQDAIRPAAPQSRQEAERVVTAFVEHYNAVRLHSAIGYVTPADFLAGRHKEILAERDRKLALARDQRARRRAQARQAVATDTVELV